LADRGGNVGFLHAKRYVELMKIDNFEKNKKGTNWVLIPP
jgi:hypothetical protein